MAALLKAAVKVTLTSPFATFAVRVICRSFVGEYGRPHKMSA